MLNGIHGPVAALAFIILAVGAVLWAYERLSRIQAAFFAAGTGLAVISIPMWLDTLAAATSTGTGLTVLGIVFLASLIGFFFEVVLKHKHHHIRTPVIGGLFGTSAMLGTANLHRLLQSLGTSAKDTGTALGRARHQIKSGHAANALPLNQQHVVAACAVIAVVALIIVAAVISKRRGPAPRSIAGSASRAGAQSVRRGGGQRALPAPAPASGPPARRPVSSGRKGSRRP
jgi:hypothetical protein